MRRLLGALLLLGVALQPIAASASPPQNSGALERVQEKTQTVYGSRRSNVYHRAGCRYIQQIHPENVISFPSVAEAQKNGYRACKVCRP